MNSDFVIAAQHVADLVLNQLLDGFSGRLQILSGIEVTGVFSKVFSDAGCHGQAQVGVDIDLANCHGSSFSQHVFRYALCSGQVSAVFVDGVNKFRNN